MDALRNGRAASWELWRTFLYGHPGLNENKKGSFPLEPAHARGMRDRTPCTLFTAGPDDDGRDILNIRWVNPWGGLYGRSVTRVIAVRERPNTWMDVARLFTPLIQANFYRKKGYTISRVAFFSTLVEAIMTRNGRPSLRHWKAFERPSIVQQAILLMHTGRPSPLVIDGDIDMSKSGLSLQETLESVVLDLGILLFESLSAFIEIEYLEFRCTEDVDRIYTTHSTQWHHSSSHG